MRGPALAISSTNKLGGACGTYVPLLGLEFAETMLSSTPLAELWKRRLISASKDGSEPQFNICSEKGEHGSRQSGFSAFRAAQICDEK